MDGFLVYFVFFIYVKVSFIYYLSSVTAVHLLQILLPYLSHTFDALTLPSSLVCVCVCEKIHPEAERVKDMLGCFSARRIKIVHHTGEITRRFSLSQLPLGAACGVMILRDDPGKKQKYDAHTSDARGLIAAVCVWPIAVYVSACVCGLPVHLLHLLLYSM
jgi:hypothetical protein